jgi:hypothetical protein
VYEDDDDDDDDDNEDKRRVPKMAENFLSGWEIINCSRSGAYEGILRSHKRQTFYLKTFLPAERLGSGDSRVRA